MKNTKELILNSALELFNSDGLSKVTLRTIANKMGISQGHLSYHYKKREILIEALYFQLVGKIDENMTNSESKQIGLKSLFVMSFMMMETFYEYRFFMLDFVQIIRGSNKIKAHYLQLTKMREAQFSLLFNLLINNGVLRKEVLTNEYLFLYKRIQILGDFWISSAQVTKKELNKTIIKEYSEIINQSIYPYLTDNGKDEYCQIVSDS
jgi:AcrR family transcriptional regulator